MSFQANRWRCPCGANNMPQSPVCFQCGGPRPVYQPPPPVYRQPAVPMPPKTTDRPDACAVLSVVFGGLSLVFLSFYGWVAAILGLVLGTVSLCLLKDVRHPSKRVAVGGIILSGITLSLCLYGILRAMQYLSGLG